VAVEADSSFRYLGNGADLALEVRGPTVESCLARAVEGFVATFADVHPSVVGRGHRFSVGDSAPSAVLLAVLEEIVRLGHEGDLAVAAAASDGDGRTHITFETVPVAAARLADAVPAVLAWHAVRLEPDGDAWVGRVVAALSVPPIRPPSAASGNDRRASRPARRGCA
jgi:SHS2 domain-containing protein